MKTHLHLLVYRTKYVFDGWTSSSTGGYNGPDNPAQVVMSNDIVQVAKWKKQYFLTMMNSTYGEVSPSSDWYDEGSEIEIFATSDEGKEFNRWLGTGQGSYSGTEQKATIYMNSPIREMASFQNIPVWHLILESPIGNITGQGEYEDRSWVSFSVYPTTIHINSNVRYVFDRWLSDSSGGYNGDDNEARIKIENNITQTALWKKQFFLNISSTNGIVVGSGWYDEGENASMLVYPDHGYKFSKWEGTGIGSYNGNISNFSLQLFGPIHQIAFFTPLKSYHLSVKSDWGETSGSKFYFEGYVFDGWTSSSTGGYNGPDNPAQVVMSNDIVQVAKWKKQYYVNITSSFIEYNKNWYDEGETFNLPFIKKGNIITIILKYIINGQNGHNVNIKIYEPLIIETYWVYNYTNLILISSMIGVSATIYQYNKIRKNYIIMKNNIYRDILKNDGISLIELLSLYDVKLNKIYNIISKLMIEKNIHFYYSKDKMEVYTSDGVEKLIIEVLKDIEKISIDRLSLILNIDSVTIQNIAKNLNQVSINKKKKEIVLESDRG